VLCVLLEQLSDIIGELSMCDALLGRMSELFKAEINSNMCVSFQRDFQSIEVKLSSLVSNTINTRKPMRLLNLAVKPIRQIEPLFNEKYTMTKDGHDPDKSRVKMKQLKKKVKRERKGVARELRIDAQFINSQRTKEKQARGEYLRAERQQNFNMLTDAQGEMNKAVRDFGATGGGSSRTDLRGKQRKTNT
jgi:hypothetical protein